MITIAITMKLNKTRGSFEDYYYYIHVTIDGTVHYTLRVPAREYNDPNLPGGFRDDTGLAVNNKNTPEHFRRIIEQFNKGGNNDRE